MTKTKTSKTHQMVLVGIMTSLICVLGPLSIPIGIVPISLTNFAILFAVYILGLKKGLVSTVLYLLIGLIGVPVFSNFAGGPSKLFGPTGGYLFGFIFMALITGIFIEKYSDNWAICLLGMLLGTVVLYAFGTTWLAYQTGMSALAALSAGVIPFIPGDLAKIFVVSFIGPKIKKRINLVNQR